MTKRERNARDNGFIQWKKNGGEAGVRTPTFQHFEKSPIWPYVYTERSHLAVGGKEELDNNPSLTVGARWLQHIL